MASGSTSAGTVIAAVLESAGYVTQSHILNDFTNFFNSAGALIYTIGAIGGIVSIVLFGSFRVARYMLVGPALFWFAVGARTPTDAVDWKVGEGIAEDIAPWMKEQLEDYEPDPGSTRISWFFETFTSTINSAMNSMVGVILDEEMSQAALFMSRTRAMEIVINARNVDNDLLQMFENNLFTSCQSMMNIAIALADPQVSVQEMNRLVALINGLDDPSPGRTRAQAAYDRIDQQRLALETEYNKRKCDQIVANEKTFEFIVAHQQNPGASRDYVNATQWSQCNGSDPIPPERTLKLCDKDTTNPCRKDALMTCNELWDVIEQGFLVHGKYYEDKLKDYHSGPDSQELCVSIARKLGFPLVDSAPCDLGPMLGVQLLKNSISQRSGNRILEKVRAKTGSGEMNLLGGKKGNSLALKDSNGNINRGFKYVVPDNYNLQFRVKDGESHVLAFNDENGNGKLDDTEKRDENRVFLPYAKIGQISGHMDAAFEMHQAYQTRGLRQKIYSWAMNLPYYQGVILYLISVAYPFMALVLLIPSKAKTFLSVPLAWLWVKSWDVGFALVMVVDDILWNMFPHRDMGVQLQDSGASYVPDVLTEAFKVDPSYNVHGYFLLVSMCLMAIPGITGYATLKGKSAVLASFTDGPKAAADDAGGKAEGAYGVQEMQRRVQGMRELAGASRLGSVASFGAMLSQGRGAKAAVAGGADALASAAGVAANWGDTGRPTTPSAAGPGKPNGRGSRQARGRKNREAAQSGPAAPKLSKKDAFRNQKDNQRAAQGNRSGVFGVGKTFVDTGVNYLATQLDHDSQYSAAFDKTYGRWGNLTMMQSAAAAAMDAEGGFEIDAPMEGFDAVDKLINLQKEQVKLGAKVFNKLAGAAIDKFTGNSKEGNNSMKGQIMDALLGYMPGLVGVASNVGDRYMPEQKAKLESWIDNKLDATGDWVRGIVGSDIPIRGNSSPGQYEYNMISGGMNVASEDY